MSKLANLKENWRQLRIREGAKMQNMTFREKVEYILQNWGLEIVAILTGIALLVVGAFFLDNSTNNFIISMGLVDTEMDGDRMDEIKADFKAYLGDTARKNVVGIEANLASAGGTVEVVDDYFIYEHQQTSLMLINSGTIDCYLCPESYVKFLQDCDAVLPVKEALGEEKAAQYSGALALDGNALLVSSKTAKDYFGYLPEDEPMYLVYTICIHYPDVERHFTDFVMSK